MKINNLLTNSIMEHIVLKLKRIWHFLKLIIALICYGPIRTNIKFIGVTGTDGKTTTANFIFQILKSANKKVGMINTLGVYFGDTSVDTGPHTTTPTYSQIKKYITRMEQEGMEYIIIEATAHGLFQFRLFGIPFGGSVLTNITNEHLDYFYDIEKYIRAKQILFNNSEFAVINNDDHNCLKIKHKKIISYGINSPAKYQAYDISLNSNGSVFKINNDGQSVQIRIGMPGSYNIYNALAASALCRELLIDWDHVVSGLGNLTEVKGRFELLKLLNSDFNVVIDFAHTPNALDNVLTSCRKSLNPNRIILVFGCAGLRDAVKRPEMGRIAAEKADLVFITAEDPRTESLSDINEQIIAGISTENLSKYKIVEDRRQAIREALKTAKEHDLVLITGKGHESTMCYGTTEKDWSDKEAVFAVLAEMKGI